MTSILFMTIERAEVPGIGLDAESSLASNDSSYTLELMSSRYLKKADVPFKDTNNWKSKVNAGANFVSRTGQDATLDRLAAGTVGRDSFQKVDRTLANLTDTTRHGGNQDPDKEAKAELVVMRTRQENCRNFIAYCGNSCSTGPWSKRGRRYA